MLFSSPIRITGDILDDDIKAEIQRELKPRQESIPTQGDPSRDLPSVQSDLPILIDGNAAFHSNAITEGWNIDGRDGSAGNPYLIDSLNITGPSSSPLIDIRNTDIHFQINNSHLTGGQLGIRLDNVSHGMLTNNEVLNNTSHGIYIQYSANITLSSNTAANNTNSGIYMSLSDNITTTANTAVNNTGRGIYYSESENSTISDNFAAHNGQTGISAGWLSRNNTVSRNTATNNSRDGIQIGQRAGNSTVIDNIAANNTRYGFYISDSGNVTIENNTATNNGQDGIYLTSSGNCMMVNNTIANSHRYGIHLSYTANTTISQNSLTNNGFYIYGLQLDHYFQTALVNNTVNGKQVVYWENVIGGTVPEGASQIILVNCTDVEITGQNISNASVGVLAAFSPQLVIQNNVISDNYIGIHLRFADQADCSNNTLSDNEIGLNLDWDSGNSTIRNNTITNSDQYGIYLRKSGNNTILNNDFTNGGIRIAGDEFGHYLQATVATNTVNGKPLLYWENSTGGSVPSGVGQVILVNSPDVVVDSQTLTDTSVGVLAAFSSNLTVFNTTFGKNYYAIDLWNCSNFNISQNYISNSGDYSAYIQYSEHGLLTNNTIANSPLYGIYLRYSGNSTLSANVIAKTQAGIYSQYSENTTFSDNIVAKSAEHGIYVYECDNSTLSANTVTNSTKYGMRIWYSDNITVSGNLVSNTLESRGIYMSSVDNSTCSDNVIANSGTYGLFLSSTNSINVTGNSFFGNNQGENPQGTSQAYDVGSFTNFSYNYWDDWTSPDAVPAGGDGIVDDPYPIDGNANNEDTHPLTAPASAHELSPLAIWHPLRGTILSGTAIIQWTTATDTWGHSVTYNVSYSADAGTTWAELATGLTKTEYAWNTSAVADGKAFLIKIVVSDGQGLNKETISKGLFSIRNAPHTLSSPTLSNPTGGETISATITIQWTAVIDSWTDAWGDTVTYSVYYSADSGTTWSSLATGLATTSLEWDTTTVTNGPNYLLKVVALCSEGLTVNAQMTNTFWIINVPEEMPSEEPSSEEEDAEDAPVTVIVVAGAIMLLVGGTLFIRRRRRRRN